MIKKIISLLSIKSKDLNTSQALNIKQKEDIVIINDKKENITIKKQATHNKEEPNMLIEYQNEIIALILILVVSIIYFTIRKPKKKTVGIVETIEPAQTDETIQEVSIDEFDTQDIKQIEEEKVTSPAKKIRKRSVPSHTKITKQDFKEFAGTRILVAEDNLINQKVITGLLADTGIEITLADDGQEALDILKSDSDFTIILMDAHMPRVDGFEATRTIRANPNYAHIVVVALSGDTAADDIAKMTQSGMQEHLEKPLRMDALYDILYAYTGNEQEINSEVYIHIVATKELNGNKGLEICGGDEEFYHEILNEFVTTYEYSTDRLCELLENKELVQADKLLLDIIGVTANIGADSLNTIASTIKEALKDTDEKSYLTLLENYKEHLQELIADIKEYI